MSSVRFALHRCSHLRCHLALLPPPCSDQVDDAGIVLSLESRCSNALADACERLKSLLPLGALISEHRDSSAINTPSASPAVGAGVRAEPAA